MRLQGYGKGMLIVTVVTQLFRFLFTMIERTLHRPREGRLIFIYMGFLESF